MKSYFSVLLVIVLSVTMTACSDTDPSESDKKITESLTNEKAATAWQYYDKSVELAQMNGCWACHHVERGSVGPAWRAVSERYKDDPTAREWLLYKIKNGGTGRWTKTTSGAVMPPYSPRVSDEHIKQLIEFILSLEKQGIPRWEK